MKNIFKMQFFLLMFLMMSGNLFAQLKLSESFTSATFPPAGWTHVHVSGTGGVWARSTASFRTTPACAIAPFSFSGAENWLITKSIVPAAGDSLVFWFRHTYTPAEGTADTFDVNISTTDSLVPSFTTNILHRAWTDYGATGVYTRIAVLLPAGTRYIAFRHKDINGDDIRLDDIQVGTAGANEIAIGNVAPTDSSNTEYTYAPKASFTNVGTNNQFNFTVSYQISGPTAYFSTKNIDTLLAGQTKTIVFDSTFTPVDTGSHSVNITSSVGLDAPPLLTSIKITGKNAGVQIGGCNYWWANSQSTFPTKPTFGWKDPNNTPGKVVMINNGVNQLGTKLSGGLDDGSYNFGDTLTAIGKCIRVCGTAYTGFYPGTNGIIGLTNNNTAPANMNSFPSTQASGPFGDANHAAILPFYKDLNFSNVTGQPANRMSFYISKVAGVAKELVVTWENAVIYLGTNTQYVTFQAVIELMDCGATTNSNIRYNYNAGKSGPGFITAYGNGQPNTVLTTIGSGSNGMNLIGLRPNGNTIYYRKDGALIGGAVYQGPLFTNAAGNLAVEFGDIGTALNKGNNRNLVFKLFIEGYKLSGSTLLDTVRVSVRDAVSPYTILETIPGVFDANGVLNLSAGYIYTGASYYLMAQHRNSIRTWTNIVVGPAANNPLSYDLTTGVAKAFGSNQVLVGGVAAIYSGDVNQDGVVDVSDAGLVDNDAFNFVSGYVPTDVNGDDVTDISDAAIVDNNSFNFVAEVAPFGPVAPINYNTTMIEKASQYEIANENAYRIEKMNEELRLASPVKIR